MKWRDKSTRIEYVCNGYRRYGKENCTAHKIDEADLDEIVYGEIMHIRDQAADCYKNIDSYIRKWMKQKNNVQKKLDKLQRELDSRKNDQKDILLERMRDRDHTEIYDEMLESCEKDIERISQQINDIRNYHETIKKHKEEMKQAIDIIDDIVKKKEISDVNLRMLIDKIVIYELAEGPNIEIEVNANFKNHRNYYDENGNLIEVSDDLDSVNARNNLIRRSRGRKSSADACP